MRLFVAVWPSPEVVDVLQRLDRPDAAGIRWTKPEQWHVTLRFLGNVLDDDVADVVGALGALRAPRPTVTIGPATASFGRRILMVPADGLDDVAAGTVAATSSFGEPPDDRPFSGHLTLARGTDVRRFTGVPLAGTWSVDELTLVRSTTGRDGARYDTVARFPLAVL